MDKYIYRTDVLVDLTDKCIKWYYFLLLFSGTLTHKAKVRDIVDKKKGALVIIDG